jgi:tetratricopeptide (TPR) repeat protein
MWSGYLRSGFGAFIALLVAGACASGPATSRWLPPAMLEELRTQQEYADFLVARYAGMTGDSASAATYYARAFSNSKTDSDLLELAAFATMAAGDMPGAIRVAKSADKDVAAEASSAQLALVIDEIASGRNAQAIARLSNPGVGVYNMDLRDVLGAWLTAQSNVDDALKAAEWMTPVAGMRGDRDVLRALVLMAGKRDAEALQAFEQAQRTTVSAPDVVFTLAARLAASRGETDRARAMLAGLRPPMPAGSALLAEIDAGRKFARPTLDAKPGAALLIHVVSSSARTRLHPETNLMRQVAALHLDPELAPARLVQAEALEAQDRADEAIEVLRLVKIGSPWRADAQMQLAETLARMDQADDARAMVADAAKSTRRDILARAADFYRTAGDYTEAVALYDRLMALDTAAGAPDWRVLAARSMSRNAGGDWAGAEADLLQALELEPDQPELLNSLGYNWIDRGEKLEAGMALIQRAVAARPDLGHIVDSYGWAHFRLGQYAEAIPYLERAAALAPTEAEIIDHLGDAYWQAGRQKEARYAWTEALRLKPEETREASLKAKLERGLPAGASTSLAARP